MCSCVFVCMRERARVRGGRKKETGGQADRQKHREREKERETERECVCVRIRFCVRIHPHMTICVWKRLLNEVRCVYKEAITLMNSPPCFHDTQYTGCIYRSGSCTVSEYVDREPDA